VEIGTVSCNEMTCDIQDLWVQTTGCQTDETQEIYFNFFQENEDSIGFSVLIDGEFITSFPFDPLGDSIGYHLPNLSLSSGEHTLTVCKESDINCCETITFIAPNCSNEHDCSIFDIETDISDCQPDGTVDVSLNFEHDNLNSDFFTILLNGSNYDTFRLAQLPINLNNLNLYPDSNILSICVYQSTTIDTNDNFECCTEMILDAPICDTTCEISNLFVKVGPCQPDNLFDLLVEFDHQNAYTTGFDAFIDGEFYGFIPFFASSGFPLSNLELAAGAHSLTICGNDQPDCCQRIAFTIPDCTNTSDCRVTFVQAEASECKPNNLHDVLIDFEHEALTGEYFELSLGGAFFDTFRLTELPLTIPDIDLQEGSNLVEICVYQSSSPLTTDVISCCVQAEIQIPTCPNDFCPIYNFQKENVNCNEDGTYNIEFSFNSDSIDLNLVNVLVGEERYGFDRLPSGHFQIKNVPAPLGPNRLTICYKDDFIDCCISIDFYALDCNDIGNCQFFFVGAEARPCDSSGYAWVDLTFNIENPSSNQFEIIGNDGSYGIFEYGQGNYTIGPVQGDGITAYEFMVQDIENPTCQGFTSIPPFVCQPLNNDCQIDSLSIDVSDCALDGTVDIRVLFDTELGNDSGFNVFIDERYIETYGYHQIPFVLNKINLPAGNHQLSICPNDMADCCITQEIFIPECGTCAITNVTAIASDCENEDYFFVDLQFELTNPSANRFRVVGNNQLYGIFDYGQANYRLGPLTGDGATMYEFIVQDLENASCASFAELERTINCEQGFVWPGDANFDNITDNFDVLNIGLAFGQRGPARILAGPVDTTEADIAWEQQASIDWDYQFQNGLNAKHADCNGDGIVDEADLRAIEENYFFTHGEAKPKTFSEGTPNDPMLHIDFPTLSDIELNKEIKVPIIFGNEAIPATAYGLAFTLKFDPRLIKDGRVEFIDSWLGSPNEDLLTINKNFASDGLIEVAITKKAGETPIGAGSIGNFIVIIDDIEGFSGDQTIEVQKVQAVDNEGNILAVHTPKTVLSAITDTDNSTDDKDIDITVFPNPANDLISISYPVQNAVQQIDIRSLSGRLIQSINPADKANIDISGLVSGVYILELQTGGATVYRKLVKQ
ncbi:MAG: T9SS type A sorting domain-containing protein, partial [Saprospiraceae bacterium]